MSGPLTPSRLQCRYRGPTTYVFVETDWSVTDWVRGTLWNGLESRSLRENQGNDGDNGTGSVKVCVCTGRPDWDLHGSVGSTDTWEGRPLVFLSSPHRGRTSPLPVGDLPVVLV